MTLRLRLTLLHTSLLGGIILLYGSLVYILVNGLMMNQVDSILRTTANQLISQLRVNSYNEIDLHSVTDFQPYDNLFFQVWDTDHDLRFTRPAVLLAPIDPTGLHMGKIHLESIECNDIPIRALSIPIKTARGPVGIIQVAYNLQMLDIVKNTIASVLMILTLLAMIISGLAFWFINRQTLSRLETMTQVATHITHADDLSRRIPLDGASDDEIGQLILAFNQTLERLEYFFTMQERFVADVSHELRTPLTVIKGNIGLMKHIKEFDQESLKSIEDEVNRLTRLVGELLLLAQAESGQLPLDMKSIKLDEVVKEVYQQMNTFAAGRLLIVLDPIETVTINGDRDRLKQMILNLMGNAIQHTPDGGQISISLTAQNENAWLTIKDNGAGIPEKDLPHIFERFYRGEKSRKRSDSSGFGLGLSIVYWIVRSHGGNIEVTSRLNQGTTFVVCLPLKH